MIVSPRHYGWRPATVKELERFRVSTALEGSNELQEQYLGSHFLIVRAGVRALRREASALSRWLQGSHCSGIASGRN